MTFLDLDYGYFNTNSFQKRLLEKVNQAIPSTARLISNANRWILTSALQKLVRRGRSVEAKAVALALHDLDPEYLRRRLPIIAMEDISIGDIETCCEVISLCSYSHWWKSNPVSTIACAVESLSLAIKSRSACDAFCLTETASTRKNIEAEFLNLDKHRLVDIAVDDKNGHLRQLMALRVLGGISRRERGSYRTIVPIDYQSLQAVCNQLQLPPAVRWLVSQQRKTGGMSAMLPVVWRLASDFLVKQSQPFPHSLEMIEGIPLCSLDMYTQSGKKVLQKFVGTNSEIQDVVWPLVDGAAQPLLNLAMFQIESSLLDRYVWTPGIEKLHESIESAELMDLGLRAADSRIVVCQVLRQNASELGQLRRHELSMLNRIQTASQTTQMRLSFHDDA